MAKASIKEGETYNTRLLPRHHPTLHPNSITAHHIRQHDIGRQPVANDGYLVWSRDARLWVLQEVLHDFRAAAWFLRAVREDCHACCLGDCGG